MAISTILKTALFISLFSVTQTRNTEQEKLTRKPMKDECPHLEKNEEGVQLYLMGEEKDQHLCCGAPPGYYIKGPCSENFTDTKIEPCKPGSYIAEKAHNRNSCDVDNIKCKPDMIKISPTDFPPRCVCPKGHFKTMTNQCQRHTAWPPGQGVVTVADSENDTGCKICPTGFESLIYSTTEVCYPISNLSGNESAETTLDLYTESNPTENTTEKNEEDKKKSMESCPRSQANQDMADGWVVLITVIAYTLFVAAVVYILYQNQILNFNKEAPQSTSGTESPEVSTDLASRKRINRLSRDSESDVGSNEALLDNFNKACDAKSARRRKTSARHANISSKLEESVSKTNASQSFPVGLNNVYSNGVSESHGEGSTNSLLVDRITTTAIVVEQSQQKSAAETKGECCLYIGEPSTSSTSNVKEQSIEMKKVKEVLLPEMDLPSLRRMFKWFSNRPPQKAKDILDELESQYRNYDEKMEEIFEKLILEAGEDFTPTIIHQYFKDTPDLNYLIEIIKPFSTLK